MSVIRVFSASGMVFSSFWKSLRVGSHRYRLLESVDTHLLRFQSEAEIPDLRPEGCFRLKPLQVLIVPHSLLLYQHAKPGRCLGCPLMKPGGE